MIPGDLRKASALAKVGQKAPSVPHGTRVLDDLGKDHPPGSDREAEQQKEDTSADPTTAPEGTEDAESVQFHTRLLRRVRRGRSVPGLSAGMFDKEAQPAPRSRQSKVT